MLESHSYWERWPKLAESALRAALRTTVTGGKNTVQPGQ
ncbi:Uncharacterised protein [Mycobacteroides abscessus subsp. abscessus]|nr:Uncharacterised protein [Mycobacteroides abscessus subsp. abscessus]